MGLKHVLFICKLSVLFCGVVLSFLSTFAIILLRKRADCFTESVPLLSWGVRIISLLLAVSWVELWSINVIFPAHFHLLLKGYNVGCFWAGPSVRPSEHILR